jgi:hypothetical protein
MTIKKKSVRQQRATGAGERLYVNLPKSLARAVKQEAAARRISQTSIIEKALAERYDPASGEMRDELLKGELRAMRREQARVTFHQRATAEVLAVAVKNIVAMLPPPTAEGQKRAASFYSFLASEAGKALSDDRTLVDRLAEKILTFNEGDFAHVGGPGALAVDPADHDALTFDDKDA